MGDRDLEGGVIKDDRLPPGQHVTVKWPVLHYGDIPPFDPARWDFKIFGSVEAPLRWTYGEFQRLPRTEVEGDFHCVTRWSLFDNVWEGVLFSGLLEHVRAKPQARFVMVHAEHGFSANIPLEDLNRENVLFADKRNGEPLTPEHGFPFRLVVPHLYAWKSVKWVRGLEFMDYDRPGFWERNGYHMYGDPWREQRFSWDR